LLVGEIATVAFLLGPIGLAAIGAAVVAALGGSIELQIAAFIVLSLLSIFILRPIARRHLKTPPIDKRTGAGALIGRDALVLERVDRDRGQVKIGGDHWSARSTNPTDVFEPGDRVLVDSVHSTIARVSKLPEHHE
jgi:membrane protein implicated in regulation of membrane protease activity